MDVRILIADDYPLARKNLRSCLEENPTYEVCGEAQNGPEVVLKSAALRPDLVILDLALPGLSGFEAGRRILDDSPQMPVFLYTLCGVDGLEEEARRLGFRGVFIKGQEANLIRAIESLRPALHQVQAS
jgi:DNA-binding NarL/FixJ family response regulator